MAGREDGGGSALLDAVTLALAEVAHDGTELLAMVARTAGMLLSSTAVVWLGPGGPVAADGDEAIVLGVGPSWAPGAEERAALEGVHCTGGELAELVADAVRDRSPGVAAGIAGTDLFDPLTAVQRSALGLPTEAVAAAVPLDAGGRLVGAVTVHRPASVGPYLAADLVVLLRLAQRAGTALATMREPADGATGDRALAEVHRQLHDVAQAAPVLLFACDRDGTIVLAEGGLLSSTELPIEVGRSVFDVFADFPELVDKVRQVVAGQLLTQVRISLPARALEAWAAPMHGPDGEVTGLAGIAVDISEHVAAQEAASGKERRLAALVESASDIIAVITPHGRVRYANPAVEKVLGQKWNVGSVVDLFRMMHPDDRQRLREHTMAALRRKGVTDPIEFRMIHADGTWRSVEAVGNYLLDDPAIDGFVVTIRDITARRVAEERSEEHAARQADVARLGQWALGEINIAGLVEDAMNVLLTHLGVDAVHVLDLMHGADFLVLRASVGHSGAPDGIVLIPTGPTASPAGLALATNEPVTSADLRSESRFDAPALWTDSGCSSALEVPIPGPDEPAGVLGVCHRTPHTYDEDDIHFAQAVANVLGSASARHAAELRIREQSTRDLLTGLPNRVALVEHLDSFLDEPGASPMAGCLLVLDLDRFKEVNDTLGHQVGDRVLLEVADRFRRMREQVDMVARLGGDEFGIYSSVLRTAGEGEEMAHALLENLGRPIEIGGARLRLRGSVGVAEVAPPIGGRATDAVSLLRRAEAAMYRAKRFSSGHARWTPDLDRSSVTKLSLAGELGEALESNEFVLAYQPKISCRTRRPLGVEALVRWRHPVRGTVPPDSFVPLAEQTGMIKPLTAWVLGEALRQRSEWRDRYPGLNMAVNLSASTLSDPELFDAVAAAVEQSGVPPQSVELEITESAVMHDPERALAAVTELSKIGVRFAIDDFGTGYSSLAYLQRLPVALVKVDKSFVTPLPDPGPARSIVRAVIELAHSLGIDVAAEGVESAEVATMLTDLDCDELQGYHIGRPMLPDVLETWLDERLT
jgi:diguanylate cyclase (GGDEF)-like protein/PAS domain S-box-containing protein